jgi:predicted GIY-YIG superfamily endonuclease
VKLIYYESYDGKIGAQEREYAIKRLTRAQKETLIDAATRKVSE